MTSLRIGRRRSSGPYAAPFRFGGAGKFVRVGTTLAGLDLSIERLGSGLMISKPRILESGSQILESCLLSTSRGALRVRGSRVWIHLGDWLAGGGFVLSEGRAARPPGADGRVV